MDTFKEQIVKKTPDKNDNFQRITIVIMIITLSFAVFFGAIAVVNNPLFAAAFALLVVYFGSQFFQSTYYEYEYIITNGEIDIDKIIGKKKRKRLITAKIRDFTNFGLATDETLDSGSATQVLAHDNTGVNLYFADFNHKNYGECRVYFSPNDEVLEIIKSYLPRNLK